MLESFFFFFLYLTHFLFLYFIFNLYLYSHLERLLKYLWGIIYRIGNVLWKSCRFSSLLIYLNTLILPSFLPHLSPAHHTSTLLSLALVIFLFLRFSTFSILKICSLFPLFLPFSLSTFSFLCMFASFLLFFFNFIFTADPFFLLIFFPRASTAFFAIPLIYQISCHAYFLGLSAWCADWSQANHWSDAMLSSTGVGWEDAIRRVQIGASWQCEASFACKVTERAELCFSVLFCLLHALFWRWSFLHLKLRGGTKELFYAK